MAFRRYVCWEPQQVRRLLNPDAERVDDEVFLAVHSEHPLWMVDPSGLRTRWSQTPQQFLGEFLDADRSHVQAAVIGGSGSGKSHLIHWMKLQIPRREDQLVLSIPRSGTSLRGILESIIEVMPAERQRKYREQLDMTGYHSEDHVQRRERLLSEIALAIGEDRPRGDKLDEGTERWLIENLPHLFNDPYYRQQYAPGRTAIIDQLVSHVTEAPHEYQRVTERRLFTVDDLPSAGFDLAQMSALARDFFRSLVYTSDLLEAAVEVINRNLDTAIGRMLNFTADQLIQLMQDVRRSLNREGKSLILLIEDFARMQGIDTALLQALIEAAGTGPDQLCELRWAMAVTTGYYERLPNTVQSRMDFVIDMNLPTEGDMVLIDDRDVVAFSARYLNAARLGGARLRDWHSETMGGRKAAVPNRCESCGHRETCHSVFGHAGDMGLYPFSDRALLNMADEKEVMQRGFNPRRLIKDVLAEVLDNHAQELADGMFPSRILRDKMVERGKGLAPAQVDLLRQRSPEHYERQRTVLELWGSLDRVTKLPDGLYEAFDLPVPSVGDAPSQRAPTPTPARAGSNQPTPEPTDLRVQTVRSWANGASMPERDLGVLRGHVYEAVTAYIDWDTCGLEKSYFCDRQFGSFRERFIAFRNQQTTPTRGAVSLLIPLTEDPDDLRRSALALEGLLQFEHQHSWSFQGAEQCLVAVGECLEKWSAAVLDQLRRLPDGESEWNPIQVSVELLAVGAALAGRLDGRDLAPSEQLNALLGGWPAEAPAQSQEWRVLYQKIRGQQETLTRVLRARASGTKGGAVGGFVDAAATLGPLLEVSETWNLSEAVPREADRLRSPYKEVVVLHAKAREQLLGIVRAEYQLRAEWLKRVRQNISSDTEPHTVSETLRRVRESAVAMGLQVDSTVMTRFDTSRAEFERVDLTEILKKVTALCEREAGLGLLPNLASSAAVQCLASTDAFLKAARALLDSIGRAVQLERSSLGRHEQGNVLGVQSRIRACLEELEQLLTYVGGGTGASD